MVRVRAARRKKRLIGLLAAPTLLAAACTGGGSTQATTGSEGAASLEGETIHFVVSFAAGGGYDTIARAIAPYLEEELGATVVVENKDGAGGLLAANEVYAAKPDGLTVGFFAGQGIAGATLAGAEGVQFDLQKFSYVGRIAAEPRVVIGSPNGEHKTIDDVRNGSGVDFASAGTGAADNMDATVLYPVLGIDGKIVAGFEGSEATGLAVTSGDVDIGSGTVSSRLPGIKSGDFRPLLAVSDGPVEDLPDVPVIGDLDLEPENSELAEAHLNLQNMGRMVWGPPGIPEETLNALEDAFAEASKNPEFLKKMDRADQPIDFTPGDEAKQVASDVLDAPERYKKLVEQAFEGG